MRIGEKLRALLPDHSPRVYDPDDVRPLRMLYDLRPTTLPLKVKRKPGDEWTEVQVNQQDSPFLVLLPVFPERIYRLR
jgi:hypothetical protein